MRQLINPHSHSDASLDGSSTISDIIDRNLELGAKYVAITEHGNLNSAMSLYNLCKKKHAKPIVGIELYMEPPLKEEIKEQLRFKYDNDEERVEKEFAKEYVHLTVHFKDEWAYQYFTKLTPKMNSRSVVKAGEVKPIATLEDLYGAKGHIVICSSCLVGTVQRYLLQYRPTGKFFNEREKLAERAYCMIRELAGQDNFFVEVFPHQLTKNWVRPVIKDKQIITPGKFVDFECTAEFVDGDWQKTCNQVVMNLAHKYGDKIIISLDSHFANESDKLTQDARLGGGQERWRFSNSYHVMSTADASTVLKHTLGVNDKTIEEWVDNSYCFASLFDDFKMTTKNDRWVLTPLPDNWMLKLKQKIDRHGRMNWSDQVMVDRLKYEINVLAMNGRINFMPYFFTVEDIANFCKESSILMNVRGSASGSLLLYLLGVSAVNPLKHDLSFERFITLGRIKANTPPDVDMDISDRDRVIQYLESKYGDAICQLSVDSTLKLKSSIKDAERAITGSVSQETETMCKSLPFTQQGHDEYEVVFGKQDDHGEHVPGLIDTNTALKKWADNHKEIWETVKGMIGIQRQKSTHACAVLITDKPVQEYCPVILVGDARATGFGPKDIEEAGLIKFDLLALNTLKDIEVAIKAIKENHGIDIDQWNLPYDEKVMTEFALGNTETVFQFSTSTVIPYLRAICPKYLDDLSMVTALCRPGTLDAPYGDGRTLAEVFVARARGEAVEYIHPDLEPIMKDTFGIQIYQEQTLRIFRDIAGYSYEQAEIVRRGIGKKEEKVLKSCMGDLKTSCLSRGWTEKQVDLLIEQIMASSNYSFNKAHGTSYAYVAYACMYLKYHYKIEWWLACLSNADKDEVASDFWKYVKDFTVLPDIQFSKNTFYVKDGKLIMPISALTGIGPKAYEQIVSGMPYVNIKDFVVKHFSKKPKGERNAINTRTVDDMIIAGIMDSLFPEDMSIGSRLSLFRELKAEAKEEKLQKLEDEYYNIQALGKYFRKKRLAKMYSEDLRPIMLPIRGGKISEIGVWKINNQMVLDHNQIVKLQTMAKEGNGIDAEVACLGYVIDESIINYHNKSKKATKMNLEVNGSFFEEVLWPAYGTDTSPSGFKGLPVLMVYKGQRDRLSLRKVIPLLEKSAIERLDVV